MEFLDTLTSYLSKDEIDALFSSMDEAPVHGVLLNSKRLSDEAFLCLCPEAEKHPFVPHAFLYDKGKYDLGKSFLFDVGAIYIQDPSAMMAPYFLGVTKEDRVLDMCAAPGGKSIFMSFALGQEGMILSNDISYARAKVLSQNVERCGRANIIVSCEDFSKPFPALSGYFSAILLDAPCSGSAMFRKNEDAKSDWSQAKLSRCVAAQKALLEEGASLLCEGGRLLYSTCSFSYEENEGVILPFLAAHPEFKAKMLPEDPSFYRCSALREAIHLFPHRFQGEGHFLCLLLKDGACPEFEKKKTDASHSEELSRFGFHELRYEEKDGIVSYALPLLPVKRLSILRNGVRAFNKNENKPEHALARAMDPKLTIALDKKQALAYLQGLSFPLSGPNGFAPVSYRGLPLGWVKIVSGTAKNHYPKGLRHIYKESELDF